MLISIIVILITFVWLLWETRFLTVNLNKRVPDIVAGVGLRAVLGILPMLIYLGAIVGGLSILSLKYLTLWYPMAIYDEYYKRYKDVVLHRILKLWRRHKDEKITLGLLNLADFRVRMYQRMESETEMVIEQLATNQNRTIPFGGMMKAKSITYSRMEMMNDKTNETP